MAGIPYPPKDNCEITFREEFPKVEYSPDKKLYIRAVVNAREGELRMSSQQQIRTVENLIKEDGKLLNAKVKVENGEFIVLEHSPQADFFSLVRS